MLNQIEHDFKYKCFSLSELLTDVNTFDQYKKNLEQQSKQCSDDYHYSREEYAGDGFEMFVEALLKCYNNDNRIGISDYVPLCAIPNEDVDIGVDGVGKSILDGNPVTVQCKYKTNKTAVLTANDDHLCNFTWASVSKYGVDVNSNKHMVIITSGKGLNVPFTKDTMLQGKVRCIGIDDIEGFVNGHTMFWNLFRSALGI